MKFLPLLSLGCCALFIQMMPAKDAEGAKDHPALKRIEGSEIIWSKVSKFDDTRFLVLGV